MMKKYWKLFILVLFTFSLLGIHYVQAGREMSDYLTLSLKTIHGDESVVQNRTFYGSYNQSSLYTFATVKLEGYTTPINSLFGMYGSYFSPEIEPLVNQYRSFMRGKIYHPGYYYEDEERLLYVDIPEKNSSHKSSQPITFNVSSLTKSNGKQLKYTATTTQTFNYAHVEEVQFVDGYIKVIVSARKGNQNSILYVFTIDETKRTVIENMPLMTSKPGEDQTFHFMYNDYSYTPKTNFLYGSSLDYINFTVDSSNQGESERDFKLYKMDLKTMINEQIDVPEAVRNNNSITTITTTNDATHFVVHSENELELYSYHFNNNEWTHIELEMSGGMSAVEAFVVNDVLYFTHEDAGKNLVDAYNVATGKRLYRGEVASKSGAPFYFRMSSVK